MQCCGWSFTDAKADGSRAYNGESGAKSCLVFQCPPAQMECKPEVKHYKSDSFSDLAPLHCSGATKSPYLVMGGFPWHGESVAGVELA